MNTNSEYFYNKAQEAKNKIDHTSPYLTKEKEEYNIYMDIKKWFDENENPESQYGIQNRINVLQNIKHYYITDFVYSEDYTLSQLWSQESETEELINDLYNEILRTTNKKKLKRLNEEMETAEINFKRIKDDIEYYESRVPFQIICDELEKAEDEYNMN